MRMGNISGSYIEQYSNSCVRIASGSTATRPANVVNGSIRYNTDTKAFEKYIDGWLDFFSTSSNSVSSNRAPTAQDIRNLGTFWIFGERIWVRVGDGTNNTWIEITTNDVTGGLPFPSGFRQNIYYGSQAIDNIPITSNYYTQEYIHSIPFYISGTFNRVGLYVSNTWNNPTIRMGIYSNIDGAPSSLISTVGSIVISSNGAKEIVFNNSSSLLNTWVWLSFITTSPLNLYCYGYANECSNFLGRSSPTDYSSNVGYRGTVSSTSALPTSFPSNLIAISNTIPYLWIRRV